jgi:hypothetical protein
VGCSVGAGGGMAVPTDIGAGRTPGNGGSGGGPGHGGGGTGGGGGGGGRPGGCGGAAGNGGGVLKGLYGARGPVVVGGAGHRHEQKLGLPGVSVLFAAASAAAAAAFAALFAEYWFV